MEDDIKMSIYKHGTFEEVEKFPLKDAEFYKVMTDLPMDQSILVEIKPDSEFPWENLLIIRLTDNDEDLKVKISDKISLISQPDICSEFIFRHVITSTSGGEKVYWLISFYDRIIFKYVIERLDSSTAKLMLKDIAEEKRTRKWLRG